MVLTLNSNGQKATEEGDNVAAETACQESKNAFFAKEKEFHGYVFEFQEVVSFKLFILMIQLLVRC